MADVRRQAGFPADVRQFASYLDAMWRERKTNWNSSGDVFSTLNAYFNQSPNPYLSFLELVDYLPDATVDTPDTLYNCVWKHFSTWLEHRSRPPQSGGRGYHNNYYHHQQNPNNHQQWIEQRTRLLTHDVLRRAASAALKHNLKTFSTACALFRFTDHKHTTVIEIFSNKVQELAKGRDFRGVATILDHQIDILCPASLLDDESLQKLTLFLICTNEVQTVRKILTKVAPNERIYQVISFIDSIVGASTQMEQDQIVRRELGDADGELRFSTQGMYTIATKLAKDLAVPFKYYPNMTFVQMKGTTKFITSATFGAEAEMDLVTFRESIEDLADMDERFPMFVVKYLIQFGYIEEAHYFAEKFKLDEILSSSFSYYLAEKASNSSSNNNNNSNSNHSNGNNNYNSSELPPSAFGDMSSSPYQLPLADDQIIFVDTVEKYRSAFTHIASMSTSADHMQRCVGIDTEWTPVHRPDRRQAISILQLALIDRVFIIDIENLSPKLTSADWQMLDNFFKSPDTKKLTYAFKSDLSMIKLSFPEAANLDLTKIVSHVDIERLTHNLWKALRAIDCGPISIYNNSVPLDATSSAIPTSLADVSRAFLGHRIPKMYRLSNWSRRPLFRGQLLYAAVDAYCLLEIYREICYVITSQKLKVSPDISMLKKGDVIVTSSSESPELPPVQPGEVRLLCDALLTDVGAYLHQLGFDVETVSDKTDIGAMADRAVAGQRTIVTVPHFASNVTANFPNVRVIGVPFGTLQEQADFVAYRLNVQVNCEDNKPNSVFDPIQRVQQIAARRREDVLYDIANDPNRPPHEPLFTARCRLISTVTCGVTVEAQAVAASKKEAKKRAAANMIVKLTSNDTTSGAINCSAMAPLSAQRQPPAAKAASENYHCYVDSKKDSADTDFW